MGPALLIDYSLCWPMGVLRARLCLRGSMNINYPADLWKHRKVSKTIDKLKPALEQGQNQEELHSSGG